MPISKMNLKPGKMLAVLGLPSLLLLAGCQMDTAVVSSGGRSFTVAPGAPQSPAPATRPASPVPAAPRQTATPAPVVTVTTTPMPWPTVTATTQANVGTCLPPVLTEGYLYQLATQEQARITLAGCLQIPAASQGEFSAQVALYALTAYQAGEFRTDAGRRDWAMAGGPVALPDGRTVSSLTQIYGQYQ